MAGSANVCVVKGDPEKWKASYCKIKHQTSDLSNKLIAKCLDEINSEPQIAGCEGNIGYKKGICNILISRKQYKGNIDGCIKDEFNESNYLPSK